MDWGGNQVQSWQKKATPSLVLFPPRSSLFSFHLCCLFNHFHHSTVVNKSIPTFCSNPTPCRQQNSHCELLSLIYKPFLLHPTADIDHHFFQRCLLSHQSDLLIAIMTTKLGNFPLLLLHLLFPSFLFVAAVCKFACSDRNN